MSSLPCFLRLSLASGVTLLNTATSCFRVSQVITRPAGLWPPRERLRTHANSGRVASVGPIDRGKEWPVEGGDTPECARHLFAVAGGIADDGDSSQEFAPRTQGHSPDLAELDGVMSRGQIGQNLVN